METPRWKRIVGAGAASFILAALPFTVSASGSSVDAGVAEACAEGGSCCFEYGGMCDGRVHYSSCDDPVGGG